MKTLSGGQLVRVSLTILTWEDPHLLILDEPTNHLDVYAIDALPLALREFKGGVLCVSHNRAFLDAFCQDLWVVGQHTVQVKHHSEDTGFGDLFADYASHVAHSVGLTYERHQTKSAQKFQKVNKAAKALSQKKLTRGQTQMVNKLGLRYIQNDWK